MKKIVCSYKKEAKFGFGDFLRGSLATKAFCDLKGFDFDFDFSKHEIGEFLYSGYIGDDYLDDEVDENLALRDVEHSDLDTIYTCNNRLTCGNWKQSMAKILLDFQKSISPDVKNLFANKIKFSDDVLKACASRLKEKNISSYEVLHIRLGDTQSFSDDGEIVEDCEKRNSRAFRYTIEDYMKVFDCLLDTEKNYVFMSDSQELRDRVSDHIKKNTLTNCHILTSNPSHTSRRYTKTIYKNPRIKNLFETAVDICLLSKSQKNTSFSSYSFGSNFIQWISYIFDVPYIVHNLKGVDMYDRWLRKKNHRK